MSEWKNNDVIIYVATIAGIVIGFGFLSSCSKEYMVTPEITQSIEACKQISSITLKTEQDIIGKTVMVSLDEKMAETLNNCYSTVREIYIEQKESTLKPLNILGE